MNKIQSIKSAGSFNSRRIADSRRFSSYIEVLKSVEPKTNCGKRIAASVVWSGIKCARQILAHFSEADAVRGFTVIDGQPWSIHHNGFTLFIRNEISGQQESIFSLKN
jgi:hypothetical protein